MVGLLVIGLKAVLTDGDGFPRSGELVAVPTSEPVPVDAPCPSALIEGELVSHPEWGLTIRTAKGEADMTIWPHGYIGRRIGAAVQLLGADGQVVAREGDRITAGGGMYEVNGRKAIRVCAHVEAEDAAK